MKKYIIGIVLFSIHFFSSAEIKFVSEVLVGQSQNKVHTFMQGYSLGESYGIGESYYSTLNSDSFAFRLGVKFTDNLSIELAKHDHGSVANEFEISVPESLPDGNCCFGPDYDRIYQVRIPIETDSLRLGVKGEVELFTDLSVNARLGIAYWEYGQFNPQHLTALGSASNSGESGNDIYYALGAEYRLTEHFYLGVEYSLLSIHKSVASNDYDDISYFDHDLKDLSLIVGWEF